MTDRQAERIREPDGIRQSLANACRASSADARNGGSSSLASQEYLLRALTACVPDYLFAKDAESRFIFANPPVAQDLGLAVDDLIGKTDFDLHPPELAAKFFADEQRVISSGEPIIDVEDYVITSSGRKKWFATSKLPLRGSDGEVIGIFGVCHDITARKNDRAALVASEVQLSNALKMARAGHWVYDVAQDELTFNDDFYAIFRTTAAEVGGYVMRHADFARRFCHPDDVQLVDREVVAAINSSDPRYNGELEHRAIFGDGQPGWIAVRIFIVKDEAGRTVRCYGITQDITERKRDEEALRRLNRALRTLSSTNHALVHATSEQQLFDEMCRVAVEIGGYAMAWVGLCGTPSRVFPVASAGAGAQDYLEGVALCLTDAERSRGATGTAVRTGETQINHAFADNPATRPFLAAAQSHGYHSSVALPLKEHGRVFGVLTIYATEPDVFDEAEVKLLNELADDTGFGISALRARADRIAAHQRLRHGLEVTVEALASTVERRDAYTAGHQRRVSDIATGIARRMGLSEDVANGLRMASIIHDVGKVQVPAEILSKPGRLTPLEFALIKEHAQAGYDIIKDIDFPWPVANIVLQHHERLDGSGYPKGLKAGDILIEARILAVADVVEAMMSHRPYRPALGVDAALAEIEAGKDTLFDPAVVDACVALFREGVLTAGASR